MNKFEKKQRFSIRKYTFGAGSFLIGLSLSFAIHSTKVEAAETVTNVQTNIGHETDSGKSNDKVETTETQESSELSTSENTSDQSQNIAARVDDTQETVSGTTNEAKNDSTEVKEQDDSSVVANSQQNVESTEDGQATQQNTNTKEEPQDPSAKEETNALDSNITESDNKATEDIAKSETTLEKNTNDNIEQQNLDNNKAQSEETNATTNTTTNAITDATTDQSTIDKTTEQKTNTSNSEPATNTQVTTTETGNTSSLMDSSNEVDKTSSLAGSNSGSNEQNVVINNPVTTNLRFRSLAVATTQVAPVTNEAGTATVIGGKDVNDLIKTSNVKYTDGTWTKGKLYSISFDLDIPNEVKRNDYFVVKLPKELKPTSADKDDGILLGENESNIYAKGVYNSADNSFIFKFTDNAENYKDRKVSVTLMALVNFKTALNLGIKRL